MEKGTANVGMYEYSYKVIAYGPILDYQEERVNILDYLLACASGDGDYRKAQELRNLLFIEQDILAEMKKKCGR